jgi:flagellar hook protein FlgE
MFESIYLGLTGLTTFSRNLTVIGNNVSNLNTPGFKASQLAFSDLVYANQFSDRNDGAGSSLQLGQGVGSAGTRLLFTQGALRDTGNPTDLAIDGNGFFVTRRDDGSTVYTRAGDFEFDPAGFLVSRSGARVAALAGGGLEDVNIAGIRTSPPRATSTIRLLDNLSSGDTTHDVAVTVFDAAGGSHALTLRFNNNNAVEPRSWLIEVRDATDAVLSTGEIRFNGDGSPQAGFSTHAFTLARPGVPATPITLDFGTPGMFSGATHFSAGADSTLRLGSQDGFAAGALTESSFDARGVLVASYSNGQTQTHQRLAIAFFDFPQDLEAVGDAGFENRGAQRVQLGAAGDGVFGQLAAESLESANVDLAGQFSELIVSQRGYQASSQVVSTANEMIQQLFDIRSRR